MPVGCGGLVTQTSLKFTILVAVFECNLHWMMLRPAKLLVAIE
jgi:hypothetical protein